MSKAIDFLKTSSIYLVGNVLAKLLSFLLLPLYTSKLAPDVFGFYNLSMSVLSVVLPFFCLEIWSGVLRFMLNTSRKDDKERTILCSWIILAVSFFVFTVAFLVGKFVMHVPYIGYIYVYAMVQSIQYVYNSIARGYGENFLYAGSGLICSFVTLSVNVLLITVCHMGIESLYLAGILGMAVQVVVIEARVKSLGKLSLSLFDWGYLKEMIRFSVPLSLNTICYFFAGNYNSIVISSQLGLSENGLYSVAGRFVTVLTLLTSCFNLALQEMSYRASGDKNRGQFYSASLNYYFKFITIAILAVIPAVKVVFPYFVNDAYSASLSVVPLYFLSTVASNYATCLGNYFMAEKNTKPLTISLFAAGVINFCLIHLLIGPMGMQASNVALFVAFGVSCVLRLVMFKRIAPVHFDFKFLGVFLVLFGGTLLVFYKAGTLLNIVWILLMGGVFFYYFRSLLLPIVSKVWHKVARR